MQSQEIKYIIQTSKQVTTILYNCPTGYIYIICVILRHYLKHILTICGYGSVQIILNDTIMCVSLVDCSKRCPLSQICYCSVNSYK